jgi:hypothetical protein
MIVTSSIYWLKTTIHNSIPLSMNIRVHKIYLKHCDLLICNLKTSATLLKIFIMTQIIDAKNMRCEIK